MGPKPQAIWSALEFRKPLLLRNVEPLSEEQLAWSPGPGRNPIAWQLWHIAEVEDNWIRLLVTGEPLRFPLGRELRDATPDAYPEKSRLIEYLHEVREISRHRLEAATAADFDRAVEDRDYGPMTVLDIWTGVATSFAWHAGQIALTAKLLPATPVQTLHFPGWGPPATS